MAIARRLVAIVTSAAVFHHGRLSGRGYCDARGVLLGAQTIDAFTAGLQNVLENLFGKGWKRILYVALAFGLTAFYTGTLLVVIDG